MNGGKEKAKNKAVADVEVKAKVKDRIKELTVKQVKAEDDAQVHDMQKKEKASKSRARNGDLPEGAQDQERFRKTFIPTVIHQVASLPDPFRFPDKEFRQILQAVWTQVYGNNVPHKVEDNDVVYQVVHI